MQRKEIEKKIIEKAKFYKSNEIKCHVLIIPKGRFKNGRIVSSLNQGKYFWFIDDRIGIPERLFLYEIFDIVDYQEKEVTE